MILRIIGICDLIAELVFCSSFLKTSACLFPVFSQWIKILCVAARLVGQNKNVFVILTSLQISPLNFNRDVVSDPCRPSWWTEHTHESDKTPVLSTQTLRRSCHRWWKRNIILLTWGERSEGHWENSSSGDHESPACAEASTVRLSAGRSVFCRPT